MNPGSHLAAWNNFLRARPGWLFIGIPTSGHGMARRQIFLAGFETWMGEVSRSLQSIVPTSDVRCAGSRSPTSSCALAMAVFTMRTVLMLLDLLRAVCSNTATRSRTTNCSSKPAKCPRPEAQRRVRLQRGRRAPDQTSRRLARSAPESWRSHSGNGRALCPA